MKTKPLSASSRPAAKRVRCAIYTRVSTEQGLDQDFNSLDAQREASEAYIKSQSHEGWLCLKEAYDDGGYSGGSLERPALQKLLDDVRAKRLDVIVVYKVDRLTRSLADFAKLVELFDANEVSFVSVTQSFNTTSSMGRLTLNVLLSFAQFEREVTGERIRDKFAASRKKGMWMGGNVPLGYRLKDRKLIVDQGEAEKVRRIFQLYLEIKSLPKLAVKLEDLKVLSRTRTWGGRLIGGTTFRTGALSHLLGNRVYIGEIKHHAEHYPGEHDPIIDRAIFDAVQAELASRLNRKNKGTHGAPALLQGLLFDSKGNRMVPAHSRKSGLRYRYYQSWVLNHGQKDRAGAVSRIPAHEIEQIILKALNIESTAQPEDLANAIARIDVLDGELKVTFKQSASPDESTDEPAPREPLVIKWRKQATRRRREHHVPEPGVAHLRPMRAEVRSKLLKGIAQGRIWLDQLIDDPNMTLRSLAQSNGLSEKGVRSTLNLALLAPDIIKASIDSRLPGGITVTQLTEFPADWDKQRQAIGWA